jgi:hypothetical protein
MPRLDDDEMTRIDALTARGIDPYAADDSVFGVPFLYCHGHLRAHSSGWCTVSNYEKTPLEATDERAATDEARSKGLYIYLDPRPCLHCGAMVKDGILGGSFDVHNSDLCEPGNPKSRRHDPRGRY